MNLFNITIESNKILFTNKIFEWLAYFKNQQNYLIITPLTEIDELFNLKNGSFLFQLLLEKYPSALNEVINESLLSKITSEINERFSIDILDYELGTDSFYKRFFAINSKSKIDSELLRKFLYLANEFSKKQLTIILTGFEDINLINTELSMLNICLLTSNLSNGLLSWNNVESLVFLDIDNGFEIIDRNKFKSWLEFQTKTVLTIDQINDFFYGKINMNSFLIQRALLSI